MEKNCIPYSSDWGTDDYTHARYCGRKRHKIFDVTGAYLYANMPEDKRFIMKLWGGFTDIMCEVNSEFKQCVCWENRQKLLYSLVLQTIYGCIESALMCYYLYAGTLKGVVFNINPYERSVAKTIIDGKKFTLLWGVDYNKSSHED